ncbi:hypothetical protein M3027_03955 [Geoalkalibacter halelectricus]|nr:hypothetical protein [Geoalkalibacter halelectricus]
MNKTMVYIALRAAVRGLRCGTFQGLWRKRAAGEGLDKGLKESGVEKIYTMAIVYKSINRCFAEFGEALDSGRETS